MTATDQPRRDDPRVQVVRGTPDDDELAALVAGLVAAAHRAPQDEAPDLAARAARARWTAPRPRSSGALPPRGPAVWRWSLHP